MSSRRSSDSSPVQRNSRPSRTSKIQRIDATTLAQMPLHERVQYLQNYESSSEDEQPQHKNRAPPHPSKSRSSGSGPIEQPQDGKASSMGDASKGKSVAQPKFNFTSTQGELSDHLVPPGADAGDASRASKPKPVPGPSWKTHMIKDAHNLTNSDLVRGVDASEGADSSKDGEVVEQHAIFGKVFARKKTVKRMNSDLKSSEQPGGTVVPPVFSQAPQGASVAVGSAHNEKKKNPLYESFDKRIPVVNSGSEADARRAAQTQPPLTEVNESKQRESARKDARAIIVDKDDSTPRQKDDQIQEPITVSRVERSRAESFRSRSQGRQPNGPNMYEQDLKQSAAFGEQNDVLEQYEYKFGPDDIRWYQNDLVIDHLNEQVCSLIQNGPTIQNYLEAHDPNSDFQSSIGTISSAEEKDMHILFSGDHTYQFQAVQRVKKESSRAFDELEECKKELESKNSRIACIRDYLFCKDAIRRQSEIESLERKLQRKKQKFDRNFARARERKGVQRLLTTRVASSATSLRKKFSEDVLGHHDALAKSVPAFMLGKNKAAAASGIDASRNNRDFSKGLGNINTDHLRQTLTKPSSGSLWKRAMATKRSCGDKTKKQVKNSARASRSTHGDGGTESEIEKGNGGKDGQGGSAGEVSDENKVSDGDDAFCDDNQNNREEETGGDITGLGTSGYFNMDEPEEAPKQMSKWRERCMRLKIDPEWRRVRQFQILASVIFYADFFLTCFMIGNYKYERDFLNHPQAFTVIVAVQAIDIAMNFFTIRIVEAKVLEDPVELSLHYLRWQFWIDLIAVVPWPIFLPQYSFIRLIRMTKMSDYQATINDVIFSQFQGFLNNEQIKKVINGFDLFIKLAILSHIFANLWILIGLYGLREHDDGWIKYFSSEDVAVISNTDFSNLYITSFYWVIVTFSSVGYGDITGKTGGGMLYQTLVEMIGIGFFGYMIGVFQNLLSGFSQKDQNSEQQDRIDLWLVTLDRAKAHRYLSRSIFKQVKDFYREKLKFDTSYAFETVFFEQLKPRLKRLIMEHIFDAFDASFKHLFEDCEFEFRAEVYRNATFRMYDKDCEQENSDEDTKDLWFTYEDPPVIERAGQPSKFFHMIIKGTVHVMDKSGIHEYATLGEGSYFGDISLLLGEPSEFSYYYDNHTSDPIHALAVDGQVFLDICKRFPLAERVFRQRAVKRNKMFRNFKTIALLKQMKAISRNPPIVQQKEAPASAVPRGKAGAAQKKAKCATYEQQIELFQLFVDQYEILRQARKLRRPDQRQKQEYNENGDEHPLLPKEKPQWNIAELKQAQYQAVLIDRKIRLRNEVAMMKRASTLKPHMMKKSKTMSKIQESGIVREESSDGSLSDKKQNKKKRLSQPGFKLHAVQESDQPAQADGSIEAPALPNQIHHDGQDGVIKEGGWQEAPLTQRNPTLPSDLTLARTEQPVFLHQQRSMSVPSSRKEGGSSENSGGDMPAHYQARSRKQRSEAEAAVSDTLAQGRLGGQGAPKPPKNPNASAPPKVIQMAGHGAAQDSSEEGLHGQVKEDGFYDSRGSRNGHLPLASSDALRAPEEHKASSGGDQRPSADSAPLGRIGSNSEQNMMQVANTGLNVVKKVGGAQDIIGQNLSESSIKAASLQNVKQSDSYKGVLLWDSNLRIEDQAPIATLAAKDLGKARKASEDGEQQIEVGNVVEPPLNLSNQLQLNNTTALEPQLDIVDEENHLSKVKSEPAASPLTLPLRNLGARKAKDDERSNEQSFGASNKPINTLQLPSINLAAEEAYIDGREKLADNGRHSDCPTNPVVAAKIDINTVTQNSEDAQAEKLKAAPKQAQMTLREQTELENEKKMQVCDDLQELIDKGAYQDCDLEELEKKKEENKAKLIKKLDKYFMHIGKERQKMMNRMIREKLVAAKRQADGTKELLQHLKTIASAPTPMSIGKELPENHVDRIISEYLYLKGQEYGAAKKTAADDSGKNIVSPRGSRGARQAQRMHFIATTNGSNVQKEKSRESRVPRISYQNLSPRSLQEAKEAQEGQQRKTDALKDECATIRQKQDEEFYKLRQQISETLLAQVKDFSKRFQTKVKQINTKLQTKINLKLDQVYENFDSLSDTDKEYFLRKSHELEIKRHLQKKQAEKEKMNSSAATKIESL